MSEFYDSCCCCHGLLDLGGRLRRTRYSTRTRARPTAQDVSSWGLELTAVVNFAALRLKLGSPGTPTPLYGERLAASRSWIMFASAATPSSRSACANNVSTEC